jgi:hypothetical protein
MMEFDSPRYMYYFITPFLLLSEYSTDAEDKRFFTMALELLLADYAHDYYFGNYAGAHSRVGFESAFDSRNTETSTYGDFYFEEKQTHFLPDAAFAAIASYSCPDIIKSIATKKQFPFESIEMKRGRTTMRFTNERNAIVTKKLYATKDYALGSIGGGLVSPIQQQSWSLVLNTSKTDNVITGLHPYIAKEELGMFFPEEPEWQLSRIEGAKRGYSSDTKLVGGSPFEQLEQIGNSLTAKYVNIPKKVKTQEVWVRLPKWVEASERTTDGRTKVTADCGATSVELTLPGVYARQDDSASIRYSMKVTSGQTEYMVNIKDASVSSTLPTSGSYLYYSPYIVSERGTGIITMTYGGKKRIYDFTKVTMTEQ